MYLVANVVIQGGSVVFMKIRVLFYLISEPIDVRRAIHF